jgi:nucleotide-binding universal stress UspA family protein
MTVPFTPYQKILVPLDGSDAAEFAIPYAADLARKYDAELILLTIAYFAASEPAGQESFFQSGIRREHVIGRRDRLRAEGIRAEDRVIEQNNPPNTIFNFVASEQISAVVMSIQGRTGMVRWLFGNNLERALNSLPVPLLLVRPSYEKIVVPLDGSRWSESAIPQAAEVARAHNAELILLHVYQSPSSSYTDQLALAGQQYMADRQYEQMREQLVSLRNGLRRQGLRAREQIIRSHNPAQAICEFVEAEEGVSMVVMSTHGRTGLARWLVGSVAQNVMKNVRCPVKLVTPDAN